MDTDVLSDVPVPLQPEPELELELPPLSPSSPPLPPECPDPTMSIIKNSTIPVNVDDLGSGLIVVTFTHSNGTLYQGVLLQLNRERGIPCGISFPKDYCSTIPSKSTEFEDENEQPPVQQRHTYFHTNPNAPPKLLRRFNRATKPPARYKNGRLALRLRHRPVLCSKCKAYCEEKNPPKNTDESLIQNSGDISSSGGGPTKRNELKSKSSDRKGNDTSLVVDINSNGSTVEETDDCTYSVAGPKAGLVENYWKRPIPLSSSTLHEKNRMGKNDEKGTTGTPEDPVPESKDTSKLILSLKSTANNHISTSLISQSEDEKHPSDPMDTKKQNLRFCISKLQLQRETALLSNSTNQRRESAPIVRISRDLGQLTPTIHPLGRRRASHRDSSSTLENSRKRSTAVPARFRDEACITKNVFDFKRRRQGGKDTTRVEAPPLVASLVPVVSPQAESSEGEDEVDEDGDSEQSQNSSTTTPTVTHRKSVTLKSEISRTPTIKISYGSSGKGVVIEIPSKPTIESSSENQSSPEKSKAEKKALRKAKKQAKRKSMQPGNEVEDSASRGNVALSNSFEMSSSQSSCSSPPPPLLTPISELCPLIIDEDYPTALDQCPPLIHFTKEIPLTPKKRKKEKKHKKYKMKREDKDPLQIIS